MNCDKNLRGDVSSKKSIEMSEEDKKYLIGSCDKVTITEYEGRWLHSMRFPRL